MCLGLFSFHVNGHASACEWNPRQLNECITHIPLSWLTSRGYRLTPLFFSVALVAWITFPPEWGNSWGSWMLTYSFLNHIPQKFLGKLEDRRLRMQLKHTLDGLLHRTRAIREVCYSLHKALFPHSSTSSVLHWRATTLEGVFKCVPKKATNTL